MNGYEKLLKELREMEKRMYTISAVGGGIWHGEAQSYVCTLLDAIELIEALNGGIAMKPIVYLYNVKFAEGEKGAVDMMENAIREGADDVKAVRTDAEKDMWRVEYKLPREDGE